MKFLNQIDKIVLDNIDKINLWINEKKLENNLPFYTSVDLRVSKNKIAAVDTNIFPAGFNNLSEKFLARAAEVTIEYKRLKHKLKVKKVLIVPELHTRNRHYWENVLSIVKILKLAKIETRVGLVLEGQSESEFEFEAISGKKLIAERITRQDDRIKLTDFDPDLVLINNDFSDSSPAILSDLEQIVVPPTEVGWHSRKKNIHFEFYNKLVEEFANLIGMNPSHFLLETRLVQNIDFENKEDRAKLASEIEQMLSSLSPEHVDNQPFSFIKSNTGTYGMSVIRITNAADVVNLNRDGRKKMKVSKGGRQIKDIIIQEGVETIYSNKEPVYYLIDCELIGGFYRTNNLRGSTENLNTKGMDFECLCGDPSHSQCENFIHPSLEIIAKIGSLATGYEISYLMKNN